MKLRNDRSGQTIESTLSNAEAASKFAQAFGGKTDHWLWFWIHKAVFDCKEGTADRAMQFIADSFVLAIGYGLKRPMLRLHYKDQRFKIYLSNKGTICLKTGLLREEVETLPISSRIHGDRRFTRAPEGEEEYMGCILHGRFLPQRERHQDQDGRWVNGQERTLSPTESEFLGKLSQNPSGFMAQCSKDMNCCCYCAMPLEDKRSKQVGYGPVCATRWGLLWGDLKYMEKAPSFAKCHDQGATAVCSAIRRTPTDEGAWEVFGDWLEERQLARCKMPTTHVVMPRDG